MANSEKASKDECINRSCLAPKGLPSTIFVVHPRSHIVSVRIFPLSIPLRTAFIHAAHTRNDADPIVIQVELGDGTVGCGETLPRPYVSDETLETVVRAIKEEFIEQLLRFRPDSFPEALELIEALPAHDAIGQVMTAARAGVELALLDAYSRHFQKPLSEAVGWFGLPAFGTPGSLRQVRYSGVLSGGGIKKIDRSVRKMRWFGLRDFKLKVGYEDDLQRIRAVAKALGRSLGRATTLRLDANGAWNFDRAVEVLEQTADVPICCVEQPFPRGNHNDVVDLKKAVNVTVMHDESVVTLEDAERLASWGAEGALNIRISKNGGFLSALRLAHFARRNNLMFQLGCMVGETSILSAAGRRFLENVPGVMFAEGSYGRFLLRGDIVRRSIRFGYGGKSKPMSGLGWGISVERELLSRYTRPGMIELPL